jgi:hypothetical protein
MPIIPEIRRLRQHEFKARLGYIEFRPARCWQLMLVILITQEAQIRRIEFEDSPGKYSVRPYLKNIHHKKGLVEWLKM